MKKSKGFWGLLVAVVVSLAAIFYLFIGPETPLEKGSDTASTALVDFSGADIHEEKDGHMIWQLKAEHIQYNPKTGDFVLTNMTGIFHGPQGSLKLTAKKATVTDHQKKITIEGDVLGENHAGLSFKGENLRYSSEDGKLRTDKPFYYKDGTTVITGDSLEGNAVLQEITAKGHVKLIKEN